MKTKKNQKIIIDTDAGHDDVLAMVLIIKSNLFDIRAITTVAGNSNIQNATRNASYTLDLLGRRDIPIYSGKLKPLKRKLVSADVHGNSGLDGADTSKTKYNLTDNADVKLIELIRNYPHQITILTLGPLSNLARAFIKDPQLPTLIKRIVIMGGAINVPGNKNRVAEFNMFVDPEAADIIFRANVEKVLVPLDPCNDIILFQSDFEKLKGTALYKPIKNMMEKFIKGIKRYEGVKGALVYDAIAAYYLLNPKAFDCKSMDIVIETKGEHTFGMTVAEKRKVEKRKNNTSVALKVNKKRFITDFINILGVNHGKL